MLDWYTAFIVCVLLLWIGSTPRDRVSLRIILTAALASEVIVDGITHQIHAPWKLAIPAILEITTITALLRWSRNKTGCIQSALVGIAGLSHVLCYFDCILKTDLVYSRYEIILQWVAVGQLAACYDTMRFNIDRVHHLASALWADYFLDIRGGSHGTALSIVPDSKNLSTCEGSRKAVKGSTLAQR